MQKVADCRGCSRAPRVPGSLYCKDCKADMDSFTRASQGREHPPNTCWCPDCTMEEQRAFRRRDFAVRKAREAARAAEIAASLPWEPPDPPDPPEPPAPRAA